MSRASLSDEKRHGRRNGSLSWGRKWKCERRLTLQFGGAINLDHSDLEPIRCAFPLLRQAWNTSGLIYDLRQTAGVLRRSSATRFTASTMQAFSARSLAGSGSGVECMMNDRPQRSAPGAKILRGEIITRRLLQIQVDLIGVDWMALTSLVNMLEQALAR
jgi:hypothetical protein